MGLPSTVTAQTLDHLQQLDISGVLGTNAATSDDFGDEHLSKHPTLFVRDPPKDDEFRSPKLDNSEYYSHFKFESQDEVTAFHLTSGVAERDQRPANNLGVAVRDQRSANNLGVAGKDQRSASNSGVAVRDQRSANNLLVTVRDQRSASNSGVAGRDQRSANNLGVAGRNQRSASIPKNSDHVTSGVFPCPRKTDIAPCVCTFTDGTDLTMDCSAVESDVQLAEIFMKIFPFKEFYMFMIEDNDKIQLLPDVFNGVSFRYIRLNRVPNLAQITNYALADSRDTLETIYIYDSLLTEDSFPFSSLDQYPKLNYLYIWSCNIYLWPSFKSPSLQTLIIVDGHTSLLPASEIYGRPFSNLQITDSKYYYSNLI